MSENAPTKSRLRRTTRASGGIRFIGVLVVTFLFVLWLLTASGIAAPVHAQPHPASGGHVTFVSANGYTGASASTVTATVVPAAGDQLFAFVTEPQPTGSPVISDGAHSTWTLNATVVPLGSGVTETVYVANVSASGSDTVTFTDTTSSGIMLSVWVLSGSTGHIQYLGTNATGTQVAGTQVHVSNASGLVGFYGFGTRPDGGFSNAFSGSSPTLNYTSGSSLDASYTSDGLWGAPVNGTGLIGVDGAVNASATVSGFSFYVAPSSTPPHLVAAIASFGPSTIEVGNRVLFNGTATGGTSPYAFLWSWGDLTTTNDTANVSGHDATAHTFTAVAASEKVVLTVIDHGGNVSRANVTVVVVSGPVSTAQSNRSATCVVANASVDCLATFYANLSGGISPYSAVVALTNSTGHHFISGSVSVNTSYSGTSLPVGTYTFYVNLTDHNGAVHRASVTLTVEAAGGGGGAGFGELSSGFILLVLVAFGVLVLLLVAIGLGRSRPGR
jgi:hypothetical protein